MEQDRKHVFAMVVGFTDRDSDELDDGMSPSEEQEMPHRKERKICMPCRLQMDCEGWPALPLELAVSLPQLKDILHSFFTITYCELPGNHT
jgi:hypothetical protein